MSAIILRAELVEARKASIACPQGIAGRLHALRLRRHFPHYRRVQSVAAGTSVFPLGDPSATNRLDEEQDDPVYWQRLDDGEHHTTEPTTTGRSTSQEEYTSNNRLPTRKRLHRWKSEAFLEPVSIVKPPPLARIFDSDLHGPDIIEAGHASEQEQAERFFDTLRTGDQHSILRSLLRLTEDGDGEVAVAPLIRDLPAGTFSEVLRCLDADKFVGPHLQIMKQISPNHPIYSGRQFNHPKAGFYYVCKVFMNRLQAITQARTAAGFSLSVADYKCLLRCARTTGDSKASDRLWRDMHRDSITPDMECYNHHMAVKTWSSALNPFQRFHLRVIPFNQMRRSTLSYAPIEYRGYSVGARGIKYEITRLFNEMVANGSLGDEETFCTMMVAFGREGDLEGVQSIMDKVWGVSVPALMSQMENSLAPMRHFYPDSPLRPSNLLLFTIAHVFGINNQIHPALRIVDYVSRQCSIDISVSVWEELLEKTYVLSQRRTLHVQAQGGSVGQLPSQAVIDLWNTLTAEPYNIKPTLNMYDKIITTLIRKKHRYLVAWEKMEEARQKHIGLVFQYSNTVNTLKKAKTLLYRNEDITGSLPTVTTSESAYVQQIAKFRRQRDHDYLLMHRSRQYLRRWCRISIAESTHMRNIPGFQYRGLQDFQRKFALFLPRRIRYRTPTGHVEFLSGSEKANSARINSRGILPSAATYKHQVPRAQ